MQSTLSGWEKDDYVLKHDINWRYNIEDWRYDLNKIIINDYNPRANIEKDIEVVCPETKLQIELLDFDGFWFYENEKYRRCGIDEYTIDVFGTCGHTL